MKKRKIFEILLKQKNNKKVSFLLGARQVGKTTLLKALYEKICVIQKKKGIFLDLDIFSNFERVSTFENLVNTLKLSGYDESQKEFFYVFLDEFQRYSDLSKIMKNVYDSFPNVKIYASGSSSLKIKHQIQESMAGRKILNTVYPLDFEEFLWFKEDKEAIEQFSNANKLRGENISKTTLKLNKLLNEFLVFGGYPEVALKAMPKEKVAVLESIFDLYVKKDLVEYLNIKKIMNVKKMIEFLAINHGQKIKYDEVCQTSVLEYAEVKNYMEIIKETYIIAEIRPFFTNKNKELVKIPKIYFLDNGVRNFFINNFNAVNLRADAGFLFEGFVISELIKQSLPSESIKFWQDKNKHEVDVVIDKVSSRIPIEVKFKYRIKSEDFIGLKAFDDQHHPKKKYMINLDVHATKSGVVLKLPFNFYRDVL